MTMTKVRAARATRNAEINRQKTSSGMFLETFICNFRGKNTRSTLLRDMIDGGSNTSYVEIEIFNCLGIRPSFTSTSQYFIISTLVP